MAPTRIGAVNGGNPLYPPPEMPHAAPTRKLVPVCAPPEQVGGRSGHGRLHEEGRRPPRAGRVVHDAEPRRTARPSHNGSRADCGLASSVQRVIPPRSAQNVAPSNRPLVNRGHGNSQGAGLVARWPLYTPRSPPHPRTPQVSDS